MSETRKKMFHKKMFHKGQEVEFTREAYASFPSSKNTVGVVSSVYSPYFVGVKRAGRYEKWHTVFWKARRKRGPR